MKKPIVTSALVVLLFACNNESDELLVKDQLSDELSMAANGIENAPDQSGFFVTRGEDIAALLFVDYETGLTCVVGANVREFCDPLPNFDAFQLFPTQFVDLPNDQNRVIDIQKGEAYIEIYDGMFNVNTDFLCAFAQNTQIIGTGYANYNWTDNFKNPDGEIPNAFGCTTQGILEDQNGAPVRFKANYRVLWDGIDYDARLEIAKISLK